jgi:tetratricopeptide (TPR) repeat protein
MNRKSLVHRFLIISAVFFLLGGVSLHVLADKESGIKSLSLGEFEKAEAIFSEILKGDADNVEAGYYLGLSLLLQEKFDEALGIFQNLKLNISNRALMKNTDIPTKGQVEIGLARSYLGLKNLPEALKCLDAAEKAKSDPIEVYTFKGAYYLEINENTKAKEELERALELKSQNPYTYYYAGIVNLRLGNPQKAIELFEMFLSMAPYVPEAEHAKFLIDTLC